MKKLIVMIAALLVLFAAANAKAELWQENDPAITYYGQWETYTCAACNGGAVKYSTSMALKAEVAFSGTNIKWTTAKAPILGKAEVCLDEECGIIDLYSPTPQYQVVLQKTGLSAGNHKVTIRPTGQKNPESTGYYVVVDAIEADKPLWTLPRGAETVGVAVDETTGAVGIIGVTDRSLDPDYPFGGLYDFFAARFSPDGVQEWLIQIGTPYWDWTSGAMSIWKYNLYIDEWTDYTGSGNADVYVRAYDFTTGNFLWSTQVTENTYGSDLVTNENGIYEIAGDFSKFDLNGNFLWSNTWSVPLGVDVDASGNVYVAYDGYAEKYDKDGEYLLSSDFWAWTLVSSISVDSDNQVFYLGGVTRLGSPDATSLILKYDLNGNFIWAKEGGLKVIFTGDNVTHLEAVNNYVYGSTLYGVVFKLDSDGDLVWQDVLPGERGGGRLALYGNTLFAANWTNTLSLFNATTGEKLY